MPPCEVSVTVEYDSGMPNPQEAAACWAEWVFDALSKGEAVWATVTTPLSGDSVIVNLSDVFTAPKGVAP